MNEEVLQELLILFCSVTLFIRLFTTLLLNMRHNPLKYQRWTNHINLDIASPGPRAYYALNTQPQPHHLLHLLSCRWVTPECTSTQLFFSHFGFIFVVVVVPLFFRISPSMNKGDTLMDIGSENRKHFTGFNQYTWQDRTLAPSDKTDWLAGIFYCVWSKILTLNSHKVEICNFLMCIFIRTGLDIGCCGKRLDIKHYISKWTGSIYKQKGSKQLERWPKFGFTRK